MGNQLRVRCFVVLMLLLFPSPSVLCVLCFASLLCVCALCLLGLSTLRPFTDYISITPHDVLDQVRTNTTPQHSTTEAEAEAEAEAQEKDKDTDTDSHVNTMQQLGQEPTW